ncbi:MAG: HEAT repeat domain-containing protein [Vicinamibacterales bacterium]
MSCEAIRQRWADRLAGSLDASGEQAVREHVQFCPACRAELQDLDALWHAMGELSDPPVPSDRMRTRLLAEVAAEDAMLRADALARQETPGAAASAAFRRSAPLAQMAIAASLLLAGVLIGRSLGSAPAPPPAPAAEMADVRSELREMRQLLTLSLLQQQSAAERLRGVSWTEQIDHPGNEVVAALLDALLHDSNDNVRLAAVDALRRFSDREDVRRAALRAAADQRSPMLQVAAIDFIVDMRQPGAESTLRQLAEDPAVDESVRGRAASALARLIS